LRRIGGVAWKKENERPQSGYAFRSYTLIDNRYCVPFALRFRQKIPTRCQEARNQSRVLGFNVRTIGAAMRWLPGTMMGKS
jgi:hypothetical protein